MIERKAPRIRAATLREASENTLKGCDMNDTTAKAAVIYARFSSERQRDESIDDQVRVCREWCAREGVEVVRVYSNRAMSGRTDHRPDFLRMVEEAPLSDLVVVYKLDRFSRDPYDAAVYKKRLAEKGVRVVSATENVPDMPRASSWRSCWRAWRRTTRETSRRTSRAAWRALR